MDLNGPGMLDHLRNRLQSQQLKTAPRSVAVAVTSYQAELQSKSSGEERFAPHLDSIKEGNGSLDLNDEIPMIGHERPAELNCTGQSWTYEDLLSASQHSLSSPNPLSDFLAGSPNLSLPLSGSSGSPMTEQETISTNDGLAGMGIPAMHNIPEESSLPSEPPGNLFTDLSCQSFSPFSTSTPAFPFHDTVVYPNQTRALLENEQSQSFIQNGDTPFIGETQDQIVMNSNMSHPASFTPALLHAGSVRCSNEDQRPRYKPTPKCFLQNAQMQQCSPLGGNDPTLPAQAARIELDTLFDYGLWGQALVDSQVCLDNARLPCDDSS